MKADELKALLDKFLEGNTSETEEDQIRLALKSGETPKGYEDIADMLDAFEEIGEETTDFIPELPQEDATTLRVQGEDKVVSLRRTWAIAASVSILVIGFISGMLSGRMGMVDETQVAALRTDINSMKEAIVLNKLQRESVSDRIQATYEMTELDTADQKVLDALIYTMNTDDNANVRMAAAEALFKYSNNDHVRDAFINSMNMQTDPMIKIRLIDMLVNLNEKRALPELQKVMRDENQIKMVKDRAAMGIGKLI